ncbi:MAG TPA: hypothetical protein VLV29_00740 [Steroidobacteraceae bacterium]|nr:hypothetical protein [Steroidobacteraceae bacterium]
MPETLLDFQGAVRCERSVGALGLTLRGAAGVAGDTHTLGFSGHAPAELPQVLTAPRVQALGEGRYRIQSGEGAWLLRARAVHLSREVATPFYCALPPRPVPLGKRLFWRAVLALAATRAGLALLRVLRR